MTPGSLLGAGGVDLLAQVSVTMQQHVQLPAEGQLAAPPGVLHQLSGNYQATEHATEHAKSPVRYTRQYNSTL